VGGGEPADIEDLLRIIPARDKEANWPPKNGNPNGCGDSRAGRATNAFGGLLLYLPVSVLNIGVPERRVRLNSGLFQILVGSKIQ
jgi:hypothetical protein